MSSEKAGNFSENSGDTSLSKSWVKFETETNETQGDIDNNSPLSNTLATVGHEESQQSISPLLNAPAVGHGKFQQSALSNDPTITGHGDSQQSDLVRREKDGHEEVNDKNKIMIPKPPKSKSWVKFEETNNENIPVGNKQQMSNKINDQPVEENINEANDLKPVKDKTIDVMTSCDDSPAVIPAESVQITLERSFSSASGEAASNNNNKSNAISFEPKPMRNVELPVAAVEPIRQGFVNGDIIVTLLPMNSRFPWITPAVFRPELVPEELMAQGLTLTVEEYVQAMELLVNDVRFNLYNVCYKRVLVLWITVAFIVLLSLLFSGTNGLTLFGLGIGWLVLNAAAIFLSMYLKFKLQRNLERCLAQVNKQLLRHKIVVALDDRGKISCHKVNMCFIYMDSAPCIAHLQTSIDQQERDPSSGWEQMMDINAGDIVIQGSRTTRLSRKQERAALLYLRYAQRWGRDRVRGLLVSPPAAGGRHCGARTCPCQYIEEHLRCKPTGKLTLRSFFLLPDQRVINHQGVVAPVQGGSCSVQ